MPPQNRSTNATTPASSLPASTVPASVGAVDVVAPVEPVVSPTSGTVPPHVPAQVLREPHVPSTEPAKDDPSRVRCRACGQPYGYMARHTLADGSVIAQHHPACPMGNTGPVPLVTQKPRPLWEGLAGPLPHPVTGLLPGAVPAS